MPLKLPASKLNGRAEVDRLFHLNNPGRPAQSEVIGAMWEASGPRDVLLSAAGSHPGDLHKLWRTRTPNGYHMEYGYSCMGYEIPGAMGAKMADPSREVYVFLGDGTYLMMPGEIVTSVQEGVKIIIVLVDNHGFAQHRRAEPVAGTARIRHQLSQPLADFGAVGWRRRSRWITPPMRAASARTPSKATTLAELKAALEQGQSARPHHRHRGRDRHRRMGVPGYESWWDVAVAEVSEMDSVRKARASYEEARKRERHHL